MLLEGIYYVRIDTRQNISGVTIIAIIIYWDWYNLAKESLCL